MDESSEPSCVRTGWRRRLSPLAATFWAMVLINLLLVHLTFDTDSSTGGDAAGNAMSRAFGALIEYAIWSVIGLLGLLFLVVRRTGFRVGVIVVLALGCLLLMSLAAATMHP